MSDALEVQLEELFAYYNVVTSNLQCDNINFNKDQLCALCGQTSHGFDGCDFLA